MKRKGGYRRRTRSLLKKDLRDKGKIKLSQYFEEYKAGDKVVMKVEPAVQKGMYHLRFYGKIGTIKAKRGKSYEVEIKDGNKSKILISHPIHMRKL